MIAKCNLTTGEPNSYCIIHDIMCNGTEEERSSCYHWATAKAIQEQNSILKDLKTVINNKFR